MSDEAPTSLPIPSTREMQIITSQAAEAGADLTELQRTAIQNLVLLDMTKEEAAIDAGYAPAGARMRMYDALRHPQGQLYAASLLRSRMVELGPKAVKKLDDLLSAKSDYVKLEAARTILSGAGIGDGKQGTGTGAGIQVNINLGD